MSLKKIKVQDNVNSNNLSETVVNDTSNRLSIFQNDNKTVLSSNVGALKYPQSTSNSTNSTQIRRNPRQYSVPYYYSSSNSPRIYGAFRKKTRT